MEAVYLAILSHSLKKHPAYSTDQQNEGGLCCRGLRRSMDSFFFSPWNSVTTGIYCNCCESKLIQLQASVKEWWVISKVCFKWARRSHICCTCWFTWQMPHDWNTSSCRADITSMFWLFLLSLLGVIWMFLALKLILMQNVHSDFVGLFVLWWGGVERSRVGVAGCWVVCKWEMKTNAVKMVSYSIQKEHI